MTYRYALLVNIRMFRQLSNAKWKRSHDCNHSMRTSLFHLFHSSDLCGLYWDLKENVLLFFEKNNYSFQSPIFIRSPYAKWENSPGDLVYFEKDLFYNLSFKFLYFFLWEEASYMQRCLEAYSIRQRLINERIFHRELSSQCGKY